jgi:hypothetical protein
MLVSLAGARQTCGLRAVVSTITHAQTPCPCTRLRRSYPEKGEGKTHACEKCPEKANGRRKLVLWPGFAN